MIRMI